VRDLPLADGAQLRLERISALHGIGGELAQSRLPWFANSTTEILRFESKLRRAWTAQCSATQTFVAARSGCHFKVVLAEDPGANHPRWPMKLGSRPWGAGSGLMNPLCVRLDNPFVLLDELFTRNRP